MISVAVMAHPKRAQWVPGLARAIDADVRVVWDEGWNDRHITGLHALKAYDPAASHHLIVQDDAIVCRDLVAGLEKALEHVPDGCPVSAFAGRVRPNRDRVLREYDKSRRAGSSWMTFPGPWWGPAVVVPTAAIGELADWYESSQVVNYDRRMARWFEHVAGVDCWYTRPCLVEHRSGDENPSLVRDAKGRVRTGKNRISVEFIGTDVSALTVDWSRLPPAVEPPATVTLRHDSGDLRKVPTGSVLERKLLRSGRWKETTDGA